MGEGFDPYISPPHPPSTPPIVVVIVSDEHPTIRKHTVVGEGNDIGGEPLQFYSSETDRPVPYATVGRLYLYIITYVYYYYDFAANIESGGIILS